ncbi:MAG: mechanosensitive ion channel [Bacteroidetes bacterium]|nr:mechanosensitive ion channel [Bacteroidota bacterium]
MHAFRHIAGLLILFGWFVGAQMASANSPFQESNVRIATIGSDSLKVQPGGVVTVVYHVSSEASGATENYTPEFDLPEGWGLALGNTPITVKGESPTVRVVLYSIPKSSLSGHYNIRLQLKSASGETAASIETSIFVKEVYSMTFEQDNVETFIPAGKTIQTSFHVSNNGNTPITVAISAKQRPLTQVDLPVNSLRLLPGESQTVETTIHTDADVDHSASIGIRYEARIKELKESVIYKTVSFNIVPVYARVRPKATGVPLSLTLESVGDENGVSPQAKIATAIEALGGEISVNAIISERPREKFFGSDQYVAVQYRRKDLTVKLGDHSSSLSPLTINGESGLGVGATLDRGTWNVKTTVQRTRNSYPTQNQAGLSVGKRLSESSFLSVNLLQRNGLYNGTAFTVRSETQPFGPTSKLDAECGIDSYGALSDPSCSVSFAKGSSRWTLRAKGQHASKSFPGTASGLTQISKNATFKINQYFRLDNSLSYLVRDLGVGYTRTNSIVKSGVTYTDRVIGGTYYITLHGIRTQTNYTSLIADLVRRELHVRMSGGYDRRKFGASLALENGGSTSSEDSESGSMQRIRANVRGKLRSSWSINGSYEWANGNLSALEGNQKQSLYGLGTTFALPRGMAFSATAFLSHVTTSVTQQYVSTRARLSKTFRSGHLLTAQIQFNESTGRQTIRSSDYSLSYSLPLALPFGTSEEGSTLLNGQIIDLASREPISGALLFLGDNIAVTDENGRFAIPRKTDRSEYLRLDQKSIGYDRIPTTSFPLEITPEDFQGQDLVLTLEPSAVLTGQVDILNYPGDGDQLLGAAESELIYTGGLAGAVIQISSETHRLRTRTDKSGKFQFGQLPTGTYKVEFVSGNLKEHQRIKQPIVNVIVEANNVNSLVFQVVPVRKVLRIIKTSSLSIREDDTASPEDHTDALTRKSSRKAQVEPLPSNDVVSVETKKSQQVEARRSGSWQDLLRDSAVQESKVNKQGAGIAPFYVDVNPGSPKPRFDSPIHLFLIILSVAFYLIAIELIIRNQISKRRSAIVSIGRPVWIWAYRQISVYVCLLVGAGYFLGPLGGFSIALGLAGISLSIEFKQQYQNIGAILFLLIKSQVKRGSWIAYRDSVAQVTDLNLQSITLTFLDGNVIEIKPVALLHVSVSKWKPEQVRRETIEMRVPRISNLRTIRETVSDTLMEFAPVGTRQHAHILFEDLNAELTLIKIKTVIDGNKTTLSNIEAVLERRLREAGIPISRKVEKSADTVAAKSETTEKNAFPPLRLVEINNKDAA